MARRSKGTSARKSRSNPKKTTKSKSFSDSKTNMARFHDAYRIGRGLSENE